MIGEGDKGEKMRELMDLLEKEQTLIGKINGHSGQKKVAEREIEYWNSVLAKMDEDVEDFVKAKWMRAKEKAEARAKYHAKMMEEARKELEEVRRRIREIVGGDVE